MNFKLIISVHIRKCAGTTLRNSLKNYFGNKVLFDYGDEIGSEWPSSIKKREVSLANLTNQKKEIIGNFDIVHGHFYKDKYDIVDCDKEYITFVRNPVTRLLSNYYYLKKNLNRKNPDSLVVNKLGFSFEDYIKHPDTQNLQYKFLQSIDLKDYSFVGITEYYSKSIHRLNDIYNIKLSDKGELNKNINSKKEYEIEKKELNLIKKYNSEDFKIYENALDKMEKFL